MNISIEIQEFGSTKIYLASYESFDSAEGLKFLTVPEQERFFSFKHEKRRQEFVVTRYLRTQIFGKKHIQYSQIGAPFIENEGFISISHSIHCVGIILSPHFQVGLDLEAVSEQAIRVHNKFLNENEKSVFDTSSALEMSMCWSLKEVMYKLAGRKEIDFKTHLLLEQKQLQSSGFYDVLGKIINPDHEIQLKLCTFEKDNRIISFNSEPIEKRER